MSADDCIQRNTKSKLPIQAVFTDHAYTRISKHPWHPVVEPMDVFLQIHNDAENTTEKVFHTVDNENTLVIHSPPNPTMACNVGSQAFRYTKIFPAGACRKLVGNTIFQGVLDTVAKGDNFLVFNCGTTTCENAATMQGTETHIGLVPTAVEALFEHIKGKVSVEIKIKPQGGNCIPVGPMDAVLEHELRNKVLKKVNTKDHSDLTSKSTTSSASKESGTSMLQNILIESDPPDLHYSIWVSCLEVYNELIYDLLDCESPKHRVALRLCERVNNRVFVKDAKEICVFSAAEAIELYTTAQENLRIATSHLSEKSSLSHCIFTLRVVSSKDGTWFKASKMNQLTFCNLASSERIPDAQSGSKGKAISASIIALGKCLEAIRNSDAVIPYKDSKLTRLLQNYFTGWGHALMMVNINLRADMFDATMNVLKFSALTSKVLLSWPLDFLAIPFRPTRCSIELLRQILTGHESESWISPNLEYTQSDTQEDPMQSGSLVILEDEDDEDEVVGHDSNTAKIHDLVEIIQLLQQNLIQEKMDKMQLETDCRKELCSHFAAQMRDMEDYYMDRIDTELDDALAYPDKRQSSNKRRKISSEDSSRMLANGPSEESRISELEALIADINVSLETALDSESEAQQRITSLDGQRQQLENRVVELETEVAKLSVTGRTSFTTDSQAQELISTLQLRICKLQHQNNINETLLNQQLNESSSKLRKAHADLKCRDSAITRLEEQIRDLKAVALDGVKTSNALVKEEIDQFQQLLDSVNAKLKQNEAVVNVLNTRCTLNVGKVKDTTSAQIKEYKKSLTEATEKINKLEKEKTDLLDSLEAFQKMLLKITESEPKTKRPKRKCAAAVCRPENKKEYPGKMDAGSSWGGSIMSAGVVERDAVPVCGLRILRNRNDESRTQRETEERIHNLEIELISLKAALKQTLEKEGHGQKLPAILEALELGRVMPEDFTPSPSRGYRLRQRP